MAERRLHVVALNWRDIRNPEAGGAEIHLHEILTRLVARGHHATQFASAFPGGATEETVDGVHVIRRGSWWNANFVLPAAMRAYLKDHPADLVVEDINKIPFFTPCYTRTPVLVVVPHLFGVTVFRETNALFALYVWAWEALIPAVYRRCRFAVISPSTRDDLVARGVSADRIEVVLCGLDHRLFRLLPGEKRAPRPTLVHFGRMRRYKAIDVVIRALGVVRRTVPDARLVIIGDGPDRARLEKIVKREGLAGDVEFTGRMSGEQMVAVLNRCHVFLNASPKEGWGLTVVEANACGVPVVGSDRPGLRDSIHDGVTGFLVPYGDVNAFARRTAELLTDPELYARMRTAGEEWARSLTWERTADEMEQVLVRACAAGRAS
ncbi:MAG TPA: glycosyltransferase family 4 protein [Candidatus Krumholzibacteria bacterium]|nr:glycosyltransferase family 4 protein [Candidatus Krumholzibacteria bacterium]